MSNQYIANGVRAFYGAFVVCLSGCMNQVQGDASIGYEIKRTADNHGLAVVTIYKGGEPVVEIVERSSAIEGAAVYLRGRESARAGYFSDADAEGLVVTVGESIPPITVANIDRDKDGAVDFRKVGLPSRGMFRVEYYDLDLNGIFDAWVDKSASKMAVLVEGKWRLAVFDQDALSKPEPQVEFESSDGNSSMAFADGVWR